MQAEGCNSLYPMKSLSIIGIFEVLGSIFTLLRIRRGLVKYFTTHNPDLFIGIDAPQFNIGLEEKLRSAGIPTMHYVSPTVWAWRHYRIHQIRRAVDHMLVLFPFEQEIYHQHGLPVTFVGHPLADALPTNPDRNAARALLSLPQDKVIVGLLPGSRRGELKRHAELFVRTAMWLHERNRKIEFAVPLVSTETRRIFEDAIATMAAATLPMRLIDGHSREVMEASDVLVIASGTATLEAAILKRPMVVTYKINWLTYFLFRLISRISLYSLPNNLAGKELLPEYMQSQATPENLGQATEHFLSHPEEMEEVRHELEAITNMLRRNADERAAMALINFLQRQKALSHEEKV
jgi:lipid-A-disaccharide synthase